MASPMAVAGALKGIGKIAGLFGKNKTKVKDIPLSATITRGLDENEKFLSGDAGRMRGMTDSAVSGWQGLLPRMKERLDTDLLRMDRYRSGGPQESRRRAAIGRFGDSLRAANQDSIDAAGRRFSQQQALLGGGGMSPFMTAMMGNQLGAMNRQVAANIGGLNLGNIDRYEGFERGDFGRGQALMNAYGNSMMQPVRALSQGNQAVNNMYSGAIANRRNSMDRLIQQKPNTMQKISNALSGTGDAMQGQMLTNAYMNKLDPSGGYNTWSSFNPFSRGGGSSVRTWSPKGYEDFMG